MGILPLNLPHFLKCLVPCRFLNSGNPFGIAAADLLAVDFLNPAAQRAGAGEEDFVRLHHLLHARITHAGKDGVVLCYGSLYMIGEIEAGLAQL